jgi:Helix-turn-helix domain
VLEPPDLNQAARGIVIVSDQRRGLEEIAALLDNGRIEEARGRTSDLLRDLDRDALVTTTEAATLLGIRSVNTLKMLVKRHGLRKEQVGNRTMIPVGELERLQETRIVRDIQASDRAHDRTTLLGSDDGMSSDQLDALSGSRPGPFG